MSEEEKRTKKQKIEDNRRLRAMSQNSTTFALTPSSSPPMVPETECFQFPFDCQKRNVDDDNDDDIHDTKHNIHLFDDTNDTNDMKPVEDISNTTNNTYQTIFDFKTLLNDDDRKILYKIDEEYTRAVQLSKSVVRGCDPPRLRSLNDVTDVANEPAQISSLRMITFFKLTPEFNVKELFFLQENKATLPFFFSPYMKMID